MGRILLVLGSLAHLIIYLVAAPEHVADHFWPNHARFHLLEAIFWVAGLDLLTAAIAWFARGERWVLFALTASWLLTHVSYFLSMAFLPEGRPPNLSAHLSLGVALVIYTAGLVLAWLERAEARV